MRLGGPLSESFDTPDLWMTAVKKAGYRAAFCPVGLDTGKEIISAYSSAADKADIVIAEVGAWSNPLSSDYTEREDAKTKCKKALSLADNIGANCCVNISGSRGKKWDGPDKRDLTEDTFDIIVVTVREIIDEVKPVRTFYTLETMPWMYPDSVDNYLRLVKSIDRKAFAVHFDPVNLINSPSRYFSNSLLIKDFVDRLGVYIRSCHAKDIILEEKLTVHLGEVRPGLGGLDYHTYIKEVNRISDEIPLMLEHLPSEKEYRLAARYIHNIAEESGVTI